MKNNDIYVIYGDNPKSMVAEILKGAAVEEEIPKNARIGLKPNLVVAKPSSSGATTTPELVAGVIEYLQGKGYSNICIMEGSWVGDRTSSAFRVCGYQELAKRYNVELIDLQTDSSVERSVEGMSLKICKKAAEIDFLINMPVLKGHCQTNMTCALKNMKGCIPDSEKRRYHTMGLHKPIAYLNKALKHHLIIVDGLNGDLNFEEGGNPVQMNRVIVGKDPVLVDAYAAQLMGYSLEEVPYIGIAEKIGVGSSDVRKASITEINKDSGVKKLTVSRKAQSLAKYIDERDACSACYGSLVHALERLSERGTLSRIKEKVHIGQGFKGEKLQGVGIGMCTRGAAKCIEGCPPKAIDIVDFLEKNT